MIKTFRRRLNVYLAFAAMTPKLFLAYSAWVWVEFFAQILSMTIFVFFWRAVYAENTVISGLSLQQTLNYILIAQVLAPIVQSRSVFRMGWLIGNGMIAVELIRPVDFQARSYVESLADLATFLITKIPLALLAWLIFGLQLPGDPLVWVCFAVSLLLGATIIFFADWAFSCLAFYTTETWGLSVVREGVVAFFSGALLPLAMMPGWLQAIGRALPFAQVLYVPVSILGGIIPVASAPGAWLIQLLWIAGLGLFSRVFYNIAIRKVTVQGG
ncbi:MAG: ABC-2 family transporter protein [Chloroflexota bacterium]